MSEVRVCDNCTGYDSEKDRFADSERCFECVCTEIEGDRWETNEESEGQG